MNRAADYTQTPEPTRYFGMTTTSERVCKTCGGSEDDKHLERCSVCVSYFCPDCAHRAYGGRKFCSAECARTYYFHGDEDDDPDTGIEG
jgi:hypothetical protein